MKVYIGPYGGEEKRKVEIEIHDYDIWNMDSTLGLIILPMLYKIRDDKQGYPIVNDEDVPEEMRTVEFPPDHVYSTNKHEEEASYFLGEKRWAYILDCMIYSFEQLNSNFAEEEKYWLVKGEIDMDSLESDEEDTDDEKFHELKWTVEPELDREGMEAYRDRVDKGFTLFGKYFTRLWT